VRWTDRRREAGRRSWSAGWRLGRLRRRAERRWAPFYLKGLILPGACLEHRADGDPHRPRRHPAAASLRLDLALGHGISGGRAGEGRRPAGRGAGRGRHRAGEGRPALGGGEAAVLRPARQAGQRPGPGLTDPGPCRGVGLRLFLPEAWCADAERRRAVGVPGSSARTARAARANTPSPTVRPTPRPRSSRRRSGPPSPSPCPALPRRRIDRWIGEPMHPPMKDKLGLDHLEGRSWRGLHHPVLLGRLAFVFLQHLRLGGKAPSPHPSPDRHQGRACQGSGGTSWRPLPASCSAARSPTALRPSPSAMNAAG
jgi:hypothetical protein